MNQLFSEFDAESASEEMNRRVICQTKTVRNRLFFNDCQICALQPRRSAADKVIEPYNSNAQSSFVELVIVIDNQVYKSMNSDLSRAHKYCKDIANIINAVSVFRHREPALFLIRLIFCSSMSH